MALEDIAKKNHSWLRLPSGETPGFVYNVKVHGGTPGEWDKSVTYANDLVLYLASVPLDPFTEKVTGYKRMVNYMPGGTQWLVTLDPKIKTANDLIGKKVAVGGMSQIQWGLPHYFLLGDAGLGIADQMDLVYVGWKGAVAALLDGTADVSCIGIYGDPAHPEEMSPPGKVAELFASGRTLYHIGFPKESFDAAQAKGVPIYSMVLPAGTVKDQTEDVLICTMAHQQVAKDIFPEDLAYEIVKLWIDNYDKFKEYHAWGKFVTPESMAFGHTKKTLHPGSVRAFEEAGISIPEK